MDSVSQIGTDSGLNLCQSVKKDPGYQCLNYHSLNFASRITGTQAIGPSWYWG